MRIEGVSSTQPSKAVEVHLPGSGTGKVAGTAEREGKSQQPRTDMPRQERVSEEDMIASIEKANKNLNIYDKRLEFSIHEKTKEIMVKVIDQNTDEIIREIPSQKILDVLAGILEFAGLMVDEKA